MPNHMNEILKYLSTQGECRDTDISKATGLSVEVIHRQLTELASKNQVMLCQSTRYEKGVKIEGVSCRISGFIPKASPGAKSKVQLKLS